MEAATELRHLASKHGMEVIDYGNGHLQIKGGPLLVNYYPESKKRSAYIAGTTRKYTGVTPAQAVRMALEPPPLAEGTRKDTRSSGSRRRRKKMLKRSAICHWCKAGIDLDTSTIDHVIPLARGGLDNANNTVLACEICNRGRGHEMPEMRKQ